MATIKNLSKWILPVYKDYFLDYTTRTSVFYGGAGSGKSVFVVQKIIVKLLRSKRKALVVRKVNATIKDSIFAEFKAQLQPFAAYVRRVNKTDLTIELFNGSIILFKGMDDPEKIKSIQGIDDIVIEEATEFTADDFAQLKLRLRSGENNQIHLMFNPVSKANWVYKTFFVDELKNTKVVQTSYLDNNKLPQQYIDDIMMFKKTNPAYYRIYVLGEFATLDKLVYPIITKRLISDDEVVNLPQWCGLDFGYTNDPTAINWGNYDKDKHTLYIRGEYHKTGMTNDVIAQTLLDLGFYKQRIVADSAEPKSIAEIKKFGVPRIIEALKGPGSVMTGIDKILRLNIVVDERCTHTIEEFDNYTWRKDRKTGEYINEPIDAYNHHMDAIRYGVQGVIGKVSSWKF